MIRNDALIASAKLTRRCAPLYREECRKWVLGRSLQKTGLQSHKICQLTWPRAVKPQWKESKWLRWKNSYACVYLLENDNKGNLRVAVLPHPLPEDYYLILCKLVRSSLNPLQKYETDGERNINRCRSVQREKNTRNTARPKPSRKDESTQVQIPLVCSNRGPIEQIRRAGSPLTTDVMR